MTPKIGPKWAVSPLIWSATVDYDGWDDPYHRKDKLAVHYEGGPQPTAELPAELIAEIDLMVASFPKRPKLAKHPWLWWRFFHSPEWSAQIEREKRVCRGIESYHINVKKWRGGAYSGVVGPSGTFYRFRGWNRTGAHWSNDDIDYDGVSENDEAYAVMFILGGAQEPTIYAWRTLKKLRRWVQRQMGVRIMPFGHREIALSGGHIASCPGWPLQARIVAKWGSLERRLAKTGLSLPLRP